MKRRSRNDAYLGYLPQHHKKAKSSRHNDQDQNESIVDSEKDDIDVNNTYEVDGQDGYDDEKVVTDVLIEALNDPTNRFHEIKKMIEMTP